MSFKVSVLFAACALALTGCLATAPTVGSSSANSVATGSAGGASSQNVNSSLEKCESPLGTASLLEETNTDWYRAYTSQYRLGSTVPVLRLMVQQSNCFVIVERGRAFAAMERERQIAAGGEARQGSNMGAGQMVAADYTISPEVLISARNTSGGNAGGVGFGLGIIGAIAGSVKTNEASTMLMLVDNRSGVQIASSQGASSNTDFGLSGWGWLFGAGGAGAGAYSNTPQGKVVMAAFMDSYNQMVKSLRTYKAQVVQGQGLGTGGRLSVDGAPAPGSAPAAQPAAPAKKK